jgi:hypothetical protein
MAKLKKHTLGEYVGTIWQCKFYGDVFPDLKKDRVPSGYVTVRELENGPVEIVDSPSGLTWWIFPSQNVAVESQLIIIDDHY